MRRLALAVLLSVLLAAGAFAGWRWWTEWRHFESTDNAYVKGELTPISPRVAGHVVEIAVADNRPVEEGQLLVRLERRPFEIALAAARAEVAAAESRLAQLDRQLVLQDAQIAAARADLAAAEADLDLAGRELERVQDLVKRRVESRRSLDRAEADFARARARVEAAKAALAAAGAERALLESRRGELEAALAAAKARVEQAELELSWTEIRAPVSGVVGARAVRVGEYVRPGQRLLVLVPTEGVWIEANFKETQITRMRPGQRVEVSVDAFPDVPLEGRVDSFAPHTGAEVALLPPENATGNFTRVVERVPVKIVLPPDHPLMGRLVPGLSVEVSVDLRTPPAPRIAERVR